MYWVWCGDKEEMTIFPKAEFWGERRIRREDNTAGSQDIDYGYGTLECPCGLKLNIHPGHDAACPKCHCGYGMTKSTLTIYSGLGILER